jgi:soluble lytic murein transglycosylase-like protein
MARRKPGVWRIIFGVMLGCMALGAAADDDAADQSVSAKMKARKQAALAPQHQESIKKREISKRFAGSGLHQYQQDGSPALTLTNRPEKYEKDRRYERVSIKYEPIVVPKQFQKLKSPEQYTDETVAGLIEKYAQMYALDANLIYAVIKAESNFQANATSPAGACGLMQLMPGTAAEMGVTDIYDPAQNIAGGTQYLARMMELFNNDVRLALAGYNAGPENVKKYKGVPPFQETQTYINRVLRFHNGFSQGGTSKYAELATVRNTAGRIVSAQAAPPKGQRYVVHFHSGLSQPADEVEDQGNYWYVKHGQRIYPVRKALVSHIDEPA